jgi:hypothetical protein
MIFQSLKTVEDPVMEPLFPKLIPEVLHRVEFRRMGRKGQEPHVFRNHQVLIPVPPGPVHHHDQSVLRVPGRHFIQKDLHADSVDVRQDQAVQCAFRNGNRRIRIGVFLGRPPWPPPVDGDADTSTVGSRRSVQTGLRPETRGAGFPLVSTPGRFP